MDSEILRYEPDYATAPGETLLEALQDRGMTQADLAARTGRTPKMINEIIKGDAPITPQTAIQFESVLGIPASFWNNRERRYREFLAREDERKRLEEEASWLRDIPMAEMARRKWIPKLSDRIEQLRAVLAFFGVASPKQWEAIWRGSEAAFRQSKAFGSEPGAVAAWLRRGELEAAKIVCAPFNAAKFRDALREARSMTIRPFPDGFDQLKERCASSGVAVVLTDELKGTHLSGATQWLTPEKALIQLSLRFKKDDQFWFTFFHEAGHVLLHGKKETFLEDDGEKDAKEKEADQFAANLLIPPELYQNFCRKNWKGHFSKVDIRRFSGRLGIAQGIVVGRLQHDGKMSQRNCNDLKKNLDTTGLQIE